LAIDDLISTEEASRLEVDPARIEPALDLIKAICEDEDEYAAYFLNWLALPLQKRGYRTKVAVVFISEQGCGKGTIVNDLVGTLIYGNDVNSGMRGAYVKLEDVETLIGRFNSHAVNRLLINLDESGSFGGAYKQADKLKTKITESTITCELKHLNATTQTEVSNIVFTTNKKNCIKVETGDRRFALFQCSERYINDVKYFAHILELYKQQDMLRHFYAFLMQRDLSGFNTHDPRQIPRTSTRMTMMSTQISAEVRFVQKLVTYVDEELRYKLATGAECRLLYCILQSGSYMSTTWLTNSFAHMYLTHSPPNEVKAHKLGFIAEIRKVLGLENEQGDNRKGPERQRCVQMMSLHSARELLERKGLWVPDLCDDGKETYRRSDCEENIFFELEKHSFILKGETYTSPASREHRVALGLTLYPPLESNT
jgi:hypothetical protein